ncbi:MAG: 50S ribosomal protein L32e [ANME-2 cluster archaeon]|nr:50S ribosomal protein L32e [ANME-2 cluster archaeon]
MDPESTRLLKVRKKQKLKKPHFVQTDQHKKKKLKDIWRKPRGLHNKKRQYILGKGEMARPGYGSPVAVKGLHPSGFEEVLLSRALDLDNVDPATQAVRIARTVGQRKRMDIVKKALSLGLKILNPPYEEEVQ